MIYLHDHPDFRDLIAIVGRSRQIIPALVEKDYWIMHCLYGLEQLGLQFELKGGTSLSKGYDLIHRFSEDIDIHIHPDDDVPTGRSQNKPAHIEKRKAFFDTLAQTLPIAGITEVSRDREFDNEKMTSAGIRLTYTSNHPLPEGIKTGILLEAGFAQITPNTPCTISSWAYDHAIQSGLTNFADNRALSVPCYDPEYTLVEKLQAISKKYRQQQSTGTLPQNFIRHYYDVYCLLNSQRVQNFIGSDPYHQHKSATFGPMDEQDLSCNAAFSLDETDTRNTYADAYTKTRALYYSDMPPFDEILTIIKYHLPKL